MMGISRATVDREWRITSFNKAAQRITGFKAEEALGKIAFKPPHLLICDMFLPDIPGAELIAKLRDEMSYKSPIIAVSSRSDEATEKAAEYWLRQLASQQGDEPREQASIGSENSQS